jgi:hypothetical protein
MYWKLLHFEINIIFLEFKAHQISFLEVTGFELTTSRTFVKLQQKPIEFTETRTRKIPGVNPSTFNLQLCTTQVLW